jgi:hypothetical protein
MVYSNGKFMASLNEVEKILKEIELLEERNRYPQKIESPAATFGNLSYKEMWELIIGNSAYNFQLKDSSIIQFNFEDHSFSYYGCPFSCLTYSDFIKEIELDIHEVGDSFYPDYEIYLNQCPIIEVPCMLRYDYDPENYNEGLHPSSHLHIGHQNEIRIGLNKILEPVSFIFLLLRQVYPFFWKLIIEKANYEKKLGSYINKLIDIIPGHINSKDNWEFYLK